MRALLDTQILIWELNGSPLLSNLSRQILEDDRHELFVSIVSLWEISIKTATGKLQLNGPYEDLMADVARYRLEILPIFFTHTVTQHRLPWHHRDPFDRLLAAQALTEGLDLVSSDAIFDAYFEATGVRRWF